jgi:hypothetical protein
MARLVAITFAPARSWRDVRKLAVLRHVGHEGFAKTLTTNRTKDLRRL